MKIEYELMNKILSAADQRMKMSLPLFGPLAVVDTRTY